MHCIYKGAHTDHATNHFLEIPRVQGPKSRNNCLGHWVSRPGRIWQGGFPRGNLEAKIGEKAHKSQFTYLIILHKSSPAALYPVGNIKLMKC